MTTRRSTPRAVRGVCALAATMFAGWERAVAQDAPLAGPTVRGPSVSRTARGDSLSRDTLTFAVRGGTRRAERFTLRVPEVRQRDVGTGRRIAVRWIRIPTTAARPAAPLVFLAGGPGDPGTRAVASMPVEILDSLLTISDVIAFDQRATGLSEPAMACAPDGQIPFDRALSVVERDSIAQQVARRCLDQLTARGISLAGYTTAESVEDLEALRIAIEVPALSLLGGSYGTHLGLAYMRRYPDRVSRAVLAGVEGPDDTFKRPFHVDATFDRLAELAAADSLFRGRDDLRVVFDRIRARLDHAPARAVLGGATVVIDAWDLRRFVSDALGDLRMMLSLPSQLYAIDAGQWDILARSAARLRQARAVNGMNLLMNCASGASAARQAQIAAERTASRLSDVIDFPATAACRLDGLPRLDDAFRAPARRRVAVLFVSGTLDGRTPPANVERLLPEFPNARHLVIEHQSHSLMGDPAVLTATRQFLRGHNVPSARIPRTPPPFAR
jgi:pimeloyl-ACP methyl ester carboxylesterase